MARIWWSALATPIGTIGLGSGERGLVRVWLPGGPMSRPGGDERVPDDGRNAEVERQLVAYFDGHRRDFDLALEPIGTAFQIRVWDEVSRVPHGRTTTYGDVSRRIGMPDAPRAVGAANGANPLPIVVPCHRVVGSTGRLVGYGGTTPVKEWLLRLEGAIPAADEGFLTWAQRRQAEQPSLLVGLRSTRIYCRPTCRYGGRVRTVPALFDSAAEALAHGYRACRVCHPDALDQASGNLGDKATETGGQVEPRVLAPA